ncbi:hypothetical protein HY413_00965 [Candidatus Kaiserbacteria bacterium]|nr:hypothetical protein [Candidatus Kaiserbacteria bacterium]
MRKAKRSIRVEVVALSLFIVALVGYAAFFAGSNVKAAGGDDAANAGCAASWKQFYQQAVQNKDPNPTQKADQQNSQVPCKAEGGSGHCNAKEGSQSPKDICGAEKDQKGEPLKMPELPKSQPKEKKPCQDPNQQSGYAGTSLLFRSPTSTQPCSATSTSAYTPASFLGSIPSNIRDAFTSLFSGSSGSGSDIESGDATRQLSLEEQLERVAELVNQNPSITAFDKPAYIAAEQGYLKAAGSQVITQADVDHAVRRLSQQAIDAIPQVAEEVLSDLHRAAIEQSILVPTGEGANTSTNIITIVGNWLKGLFGL